MLWRHLLTNFRTETPPFSRISESKFIFPFSYSLWKRVTATIKTCWTPFGQAQFWQGQQCRSRYWQNFLWNVDATTGFSHFHSKSDKTWGKCSQISAKIFSNCARITSAKSNQTAQSFTWGKVENILKDSLYSIPSPLPSVKIQNMGGKVCLRCKGKTLLGIVNNFWEQKDLLTSPSNVLPYYLT